MVRFTEEQMKRAKETLERISKKAHEQELIREALQKIHDSDFEYQKERAEIDRRYHAELMKLELKYLKK